MGQTWGSTRVQDGFIGCSGTGTYGVVFQDSPASVLPSGSVIVIALESAAAVFSNAACCTAYNSSKYAFRSAMNAGGGSIL